MCRVGRWTKKLNIHKKLVFIKRSTNDSFLKNQLKNISLDKFKNLDYVIELHSEILNENVWFCSNEKMASQIKQDDPEAIVYTASELIELCNINPKEDLVKAIYYSKTVFQESKLTKNKFQ